MLRSTQISVMGVGLFPFCPFAQAEPIYYLPGTGQVVIQMDFENPARKSPSFNYGIDFAGTSCEIGGTHQGAPEVVNVTDKPTILPGASNQGLASRSRPRDVAWHSTKPSALGTNVCGGLHGETQDDFFIYGSNWAVKQAPSVTMHLWPPASASYSSLRTTTKYYNSSGGLTDSWPGIWLYYDLIIFRGPGRSDIFADVEDHFGFSATEPIESRRWTLVLSVTPTGDIQYYAPSEDGSQLGVEHNVGNNSELSAPIGQPINVLTRIKAPTSCHPNVI